MCKAFSCVATRSKVYWKEGIDSHNNIVKHFKLSKLDDEIGKLIMIEITPAKGYLYPESKWTLKFDNNSEQPPDWWKQSNEQMCFEALNDWEKKVYVDTGLNLKEARRPINPLLLPEVKKVTETHIRLLVEWDSVRDSVWSSVEDSVRDSVGNSVWDSVWDSVRDSVWSSVGNSVWGYISSLFPKIKFKYDFSSNTKLWKAGLVPSFDGTTWRLHTGKKAKIVYEITQKELRKLKKEFEELM